MFIRTKKSLGQYFLKNKKIVSKIIETANISKNDVILEVGPGKGILTELLLQKAKKVIAVEKDRILADFLSDRFNGQKNFEIVCKDILEFNIETRKPKIISYKIVANIPYYITSHFLRKFLERSLQPSLMVLMVQKEVAERIIAKNKKESLLSISVKAYGEPRIIAQVSAQNFSPPPKVDSAIILIDNISKDFFKKNKIIDEKKFFGFVKQGFSHKRKLLKNNLQIDSEKPFTRLSLVNLEIPPLARAENLTLNGWKCLFQAVN